MMQREGAKRSAHAFRRKDQIRADRLVIKAASAISIAGSIKNMERDSLSPMFPICSLDAIGNCLSLGLLKKIFTYVG